MEVLPRLCNRTIVRIRGAGSRLIPRFHGDGAVESTICITSVGLRLRFDTDAVPSFEEIVYECRELVL